MDPCAFDTLLTKSVPHILEKIFFSLDYKSFKTCLKVSNSWNELLTSESFKNMGTSLFRKNVENDLHRYSNNGKLKEVENILSHFIVDVNCIRGPFRKTPLFVASGNGHKDVVKLLLDRGADPIKTNEDGRSPLSHPNLTLY